MSDKKEKQTEVQMDDIVSNSTQNKKKNVPKEVIERYGNGIFKGLGTIIKAISFMIAFAILAVFLLVAYILYSKDLFFSALAIGVVIFGIIVSTITMFLIYGLGHVICQNNEILTRLNKIDKR